MGMKLKVENTTIAIWSFFVIFALVMMALATIGVIDSSFIDFQKVSAVFLLVGALTIFFEEFGKRKKFDFKDTSKVIFVVIGLTAIIVSLLLFANVIMATDMRWLLFIIYLLVAISVGVNLTK